MERSQWLEDPEAERAQLSFSLVGGAQQLQTSTQTPISACFPQTPWKVEDPVGLFIMTFENQRKAVRCRPPEKVAADSH